MLESLDHPISHKDDASAGGARGPGGPRAGTLSDDALDLALADGLDIADAATALIGRSGYDRGRMERAYAVHLQRMRLRPSDDFDHARGLHIIERALGCMDRPEPTPFEIPDPPRRWFSRIRHK